MILRAYMKPHSQTKQSIRREAKGVPNTVDRALLRAETHGGVLVDLHTEHT